MKTYFDFYRLHGVRYITHLQHPPFSPLETLELPKGSIFHFVSDNPLVVGPSVDEQLFKNITRPILMGHITENGDGKGTPRRLPIAAEPLVKNYHVKNRRYRRMISIESSIRDENSLIVFNYGFIPQEYRYVRSIYAKYYEWWNIQAAVWNNIEVINKEYDRQHFIVCKIPATLPSKNQLDSATAHIDQTAIKNFHTPESLMLLELWKWFGEEEESSVINRLSSKAANKTNIIFLDAGKWFCINLGLVQSWRSATKKELETDPNAETKGYSPDELQKIVLRMYLSVTSAREETVAETETSSTVVVNKNSSKISTTEIKVDTTTAIDPAHGGQTDNISDVKKDSAFIDKLESDLADIATVANKVQEKVEDKEPDFIITEPDKEPELEDGIISVCDRLAESGSITALQYKNYTTLASKYKSITAPDGQSTLDEFIKIPPSTLLLTSTPTIKDISTVVDKSMLSSSLIDFDKRYIKEVMSKDVASMVLNIQKAGIAITEYEVERTEEVMGSYDMYTVRVSPVEGMNSTFRFKLPVIEEDGTYRSNGIKYRIRKQVGD
jgi:N-acetylmuramoyl-L-alanine amidase